MIVAFVYAVFRLVAQFLYWGGLFGGVDQFESYSPIDLDMYRAAAQNFDLRQDLYPDRTTQDTMFWFEYPPSYAMVFAIFLHWPANLLILTYALIHIVGYVLLYIRWGHIFHQLGLDKAGKMLAWTLPVWMVCTAFWFDMVVLNNYTLMALLATLLIEAILEEHLAWSLVWLSIILQIKPQWAFAAALPLFLGRWRFFFKLIALAMITYVVAAGASILAAGLQYGWRQYQNYFLQLWNYYDIFPWRGPEVKYLGYGHSILQTAFYLFGVTPGVRWVIQGIKALILAPLVALLLRPARCPGHQLPRLSLDLALALYLGTFVWLDVVAELSLGIVVFTYLLATLERREARIWVWVVFLLYALDDMWQMVSYALFGESVFFAGDITGTMVITSPSIYIPVIMIVILTFYTLLIKRLWSTHPYSR